MTPTSRRPYWIDDYQTKHEAYDYDDSRARELTLESDGRKLRLLVPETIAPFEVRTFAQAGELLFLTGVQLDEEGYDGEIIEGGDGVLMVARKHPDRADTFWLLAWHWPYPEAVPYLTDELAPPQEPI